MRAHNRKIRFSPWRYLNLLDLYSLETLAEWTGKAAVLISLCGLVAHVTPPLIRGFAYLRYRMWRTLREAQMRNGAAIPSHT